MSLDSLQSLFLDELKDVYHAEKQLVEALPRMAKAADSAELQQAFSDHLAETKGQVERLERILQELGQPARGKRCKGMEGLLEEGKEIMQEEGEPAVIDAALIAAAQRVEHYEIAAYAAKLLSQTLAEEEAADEKLTTIGERSVNAEALEARNQSEAQR